jgi:hypothetical protein
MEILEETRKTFLRQRGVRFLSAEEIADEMPAFPLRSAAAITEPSNGKK